jgi:lipopolysaccharide export system protein LptA
MKKNRTKIPGLIAIGAVFFSMLLFTVARINAAGNDAHLSAESVSFEKTDGSVLLTLEGPVEVKYLGDTLTAESAVVTLREDADTLLDAIVQIELTGRIMYAGEDGSRASSSSASFISQGRKLILNSGVSFSRGELTASAGRAEYSIAAKQVGFSGGCTMSEEALRVQCDSVNYDLNSRYGTLGGNVALTYEISTVMFGDERIDRITMRAPSLSVTVAENKFETPLGGERTTFQAGSFQLSADSVIFKASEAEGIEEVTGTGNISLSGPDISLTSDRISLSTTDRILRAEGNVSFSVKGQSGTAEAIEVNFSDRWTVRLTGASVGGEVREIENAIGGDNNNGGEGSEGG